jgi:cysteinyl-tRNA synthetase
VQKKKRRSGMCKQPFPYRVCIYSTSTAYQSGVAVFHTFCLVSITMKLLSASGLNRFIRVASNNRILYAQHNSISSCAGNHANQLFLQNSLIDEKENGVKNMAISSHSALTWYSCGPTVYDSSHLGHARTYVCTDIIRRVMVDHFHVHLNYAMGITDIDDKIINKGKSNGMKTWSDMQEMVRGLEDDFFHDMDRLNVLRPDAVLRVTEHVPEILAYITQLINVGSAYVSEDGVYFDFSSLKNGYDKFGCATHAGGDEENSNTNGVRAAEESAIGTERSSYMHSSVVHSKRNFRDFALWKLHKEPLDPEGLSTVQSGAGGSSSGACVWDSPWGPGRPGWHIECSAMTHSLFGTEIDIHSGGVDLKFPHHTNEIAQW